MKKILIFSAILALSLPVFSLAAPTPINPGTIPGPTELGITGTNALTSPMDAKGLLGLFGSVVGWVYTAFFITAVLFFIFAAFGYLTGADKPDRIATAHKQLIYGAIAIGVALLSVLIQTIISAFIRNPGNS